MRACLCHSPARCSVGLSALRIKSGFLSLVPKASPHSPPASGGASLSCVRPRVASELTQLFPGSVSPHMLFLGSGMPFPPLHLANSSSAFKVSSMITSGGELCCSTPARDVDTPSAPVASSARTSHMLLIAGVCGNTLRPELRNPGLCLGRDRYWINVGGRKEGQEEGAREEGRKELLCLPNLRPPQGHRRNCRTLAVLSVVWHHKSFPGRGSIIELSVSLGKKQGKTQMRTTWRFFFFLILNWSKSCWRGNECRSGRWRVMAGARVQEEMEGVRPP